MNLNTEPIKNWFGFTRRERRSTFSLLVIIVVILGIRYTIPDSDYEVKDISAEIIETQNTLTSSGGDTGTRYSDGENLKPYLRKTYTKAENDLSASKIILARQQEDKKNAIHTLDINLSDTSELIKLPGIGHVLSGRIVKCRNFLGGFAKIEQLKEVYALSEETYEMIKNRVTVDSTFIKRININTADYKELSHIRYLEKYEISSILKYRQLKVRINALSKLVDNKLITYEKARKVGPYIRFE
jgi:DNA uptake protein ComE-like DNA-binding protein